MLGLLDNTVLSNFAKVGRPDLVRLALGETAASVDEAMAECQVGVQIGKLPPCDWSWISVLHLGETERETYERLRVRLNAGEAACLALAVSQGYRVFTDDRDAREMAMQMQVPVSGTLGVLVRLIDQEHISLQEADDLLNRMVAVGYRSPISSLSEII
jgi:predicted nucleic acid-binding protein